MDDQSLETLQAEYDAARRLLFGDDRWIKATVADALINALLLEREMYRQALTRITEFTTGDPCYDDDIPEVNNFWACQAIARKALQGIQTEGKAE